MNFYFLLYIISTKKSARIALSSNGRSHVVNILSFCLVFRPLINECNIQPLLSPVPGDRALLAINLGAVINKI
jgi:hypothetical protein